MDTAALIFAVEFPEKLSGRIRSALQNPENLLELSVVSIIEIAVKSSKGKLTFSESALRQAIEDLDIRLLACSSEHAFQMFHLPEHHRDPFDRMLVAQARIEGAVLVSSDAALRDYDVPVSW